VCVLVVAFVWCLVYFFGYFFIVFFCLIFFGDFLFSIEALLSVLGLFIACSIILFSFSSPWISSSVKKAESNAIALSCVLHIDSFYSNSALSSNVDFPCGVSKTIVFSSINEQDFSLQALTEASKKTFLEVKTIEHYK
jgi:hypothetical protein